MPEVTKALCRKGKWTVTRQHTFNESAHVNFQELSEVFSEVRSASQETLLPFRQVNLTDSNVTLGCWAKGRSPPPPLNRILKKAAALQVFYSKS